MQKLPNDVVRITMTNQTAFDVNSTEIKPGFHSTMDKLADVVIRYGKTTLTIVGHTDNTGTPNTTRSCPRARPVGRALSGVERREPGARSNLGQGRDGAGRQQCHASPAVRPTAVSRSTSSRSFRADAGALFTQLYAP